MREYIKGNQRAAVMLLKRGSTADYNRADAIDAHNQGIASRLFSGLMDGSISSAYQREGKRLIVYHRSTHGTHIQASYFTEIQGEMVATMHTDIFGPSKIARTFFPGRYINIYA